MKAIHGGKSKNDRIDSEKIAKLIRGGNFPLAHVYPQAMRATRDLLRRRNYFVRRRAEIQGHIKLTNYQYNLPTITQKLDRRANRDALAERFGDSSVRKNVEADIHLLDSMEVEIKSLENYIIQHAKGYDPRTYYRLQTVPGIGTILALVILYEVEDITRFPSVQQFCSYARLVKCPKESAGKRYGFSGGRIGNAHLKWAFSEATALFMRESERAKRYVAKMARKHGKGKAMSILSHKLGRAVYAILRKSDSFNENYFFSN